MGEISFFALLIRFLLGGFAVVGSSLVANKLGEKAGGIFAAFPAVYLAALLTIHLDFSGEELISHSILLSKGAIYGMAINILIAIIAGYLLQKQGWKLGLIHAMGYWVIVSMVVVIFSAK
ncbi:DUF3147 family protein [Bacillus sp. FJAT-49711]|uniref:DUF3147 family protein n=1 Tax=Bacillus sp. FJAT-49711 TaxID=2833585 RepID=UPI001BC9A876|nr:DUF3147 family protein [Bacillus sp. FJAT-49711]MBS4220204.1 DUF3147 family protein [Bacillus sp. FJAT-49711]